MTQTPTLPALTAHAFLSLCYPDDTPGWLTLFALPSRAVLWGTPATLPALLREAKPLLAHQNLYFGIGLRSGRAAHGRGDRDAISGIPGLWLDLDIVDPAHKAQGLPPTIEAAMTLLASCPFPPTTVLHSGHGLQAYWLFKEPWLFHSDSDRDAAEHLCQRLQCLFQGAARGPGWRVDSTFDLPRVFRLPGSTNRKRLPHVPILPLAHDAAVRYDPSDFADILPPLPPPAPLTAEVPHVTANGSASVPLHTIRLSARLKYVLRVGEDPDDPARYASRSEALFAVMCGLIDAGCADATIAALLSAPEHALAAKVHEHDARWLQHEIHRARRKCHPPQEVPPAADDAEAIPFPPRKPYSPPRGCPQLPAGAMCIHSSEHAAPWLDAYVEHSKQWSPRGMRSAHQAAGLWILSTIAARRVFSQVGSSEVYPVLFLAMVARSTLYAKSTTAAIGRDVLRRAGCSFLLTADRTTPQALLRTMAGTVPPIYGTLPDEQQAEMRQRLAFAGQRGSYFEEWGGMLHQMRRADSPMAEFHTLLRVLDDNQQTYSNDTIQRGLELIQHPYLALLASATPHDLAPFMQEGSAWWHDGFWPRFAIISPEEGEEASVEHRPQTGYHIPGSLLLPLHAWHTRLGMPEVRVEPLTDAKGKPTGVWQATIGALPQHEVAIEASVYDAYKAYNSGLLALLKAGDVSQDYDASYGRFHEKALRIALLLAAFGGDSSIGRHHWAYAQRITEQWRRNLHALVGRIAEDHPLSREEQAEQKILAYLERSGQSTARELQRMLQALTSVELARLLEAMVKTGHLVRRKEGRGSVYALLPQENDPSSSQDAPPF